MHGMAYNTNCSDVLKMNLAYWKLSISMKGFTKQSHLVRIRVNKFRLCIFKIEIGYNRTTQNIPDIWIVKELNKFPFIWFYCFCLSSIHITSVPHQKVGKVASLCHHKHLTVKTNSVIQCCQSWWMSLHTVSRKNISFNDRIKDVYFMEMQKPKRQLPWTGQVPLM